MFVKLFEVRDAGTFVPVMVTRLRPRDHVELWLLRRVGLAYPSSYQFLYTELESGKSTMDWTSHRSGTHKTAHCYIEDQFETLDSGAVIDVEFISGITPTQKVSERGQIRA